MDFVLLANDIVSYCEKCITLNGAHWYIFYAIFVAVSVIMFDNKYSYNTPNKGPSDSARLDLVQFSIQSIFTKSLSTVFKTSVFFAVLQYIGKIVNSITGINSGQHWSKTIFKFSIFYYCIVSAPAVAMIPANFLQHLNGQSAAALGLMMLTNAIGDYFSIKITLRNIERVTNFYQTKLNYNVHYYKSFMHSLYIEMRFYLITVFDMLLALLILIAVLIFTSIYFGVAIGEYEFSFSREFLHGAIDRAPRFWETAFEPYIMRGTELSEQNNGIPMLFIYSLTSFIPSIVILLTSLIWMFFLPLRIVTLSLLSKPKKILVSELIVASMCVFSIGFWDASKSIISA